MALLTNTGVERNNHCLLNKGLCLFGADLSVLGMHWVCTGYVLGMQGGFPPLLTQQSTGITPLFIPKPKQCAQSKEAPCLYNPEKKEKKKNENWRYARTLLCQ